MVKMTPLLWEMRKVSGVDPILVRTGPHYDSLMSEIFSGNWTFPRRTSI